jgi:hypothetical protein
MNGWQYRRAQSKSVARVARRNCSRNSWETSCTGEFAATALNRVEEVELLKVRLEEARIEELRVEEATHYLYPSPGLPE